MLTKQDIKVWLARRHASVTLFVAFSTLFAVAMAPTCAGFAERRLFETELLRAELPSGNLYAVLVANDRVQRKKTWCRMFLRQRFDSFPGAVICSFSGMANAKRASLRWQNDRLIVELPTGVEFWHQNDEVEYAGVTVPIEYRFVSP